MSLIERTKVQYRDSADAPFLMKAPPLPANIMVELSNACNHACTFCPNPRMERKKGRIDRDLLFRVMAEAVDNGVTEIGFYTTGEPFIHKDLPTFTARAKNLGFKYIYISTNGALATPERSKAVIDAGMNSIKFSINAGSRETYEKVHGQDDWEVVVENIRFISEYRKKNAPDLKLYITCVVTKVIEDELEGFRQLFEPLVDEIACNPCVPLNWPNATVAGSTGICYLPFNRLHLTYEGYLTLCCVDYQNYVAIADLNEMPLAEAWNAPAFQEIRRRHLEKDLCGTFCGRCWNGDRTPVQPLVPQYAALLDYEQYEKKQLDHVMEHLRVEVTE